MSHEIPRIDFKFNVLGKWFTSDDMSGWKISLEAYQRGHSTCVYSLLRSDFPAVIRVSMFEVWPLFSKRSWTTNDLLFQQVEAEKILVVDGFQEITCVGVWFWTSNRKLVGVCEECFPYHSDDQLLFRF